MAIGLGEISRELHGEWRRQGLSDGMAGHRFTPSQATGMSAANTCIAHVEMPAPDGSMQRRVCPHTKEQHSPLLAKWDDLDEKTRQRFDELVAVVLAAAGCIVEGGEVVHA